MISFILVTFKSRLVSPRNHSLKAFTREKITIITMAIVKSRTSSHNDGHYSGAESSQSTIEDKRKFTIREQLQGFPLTQIAVLMAARVAEPISYTSLFPYVFFMVKYLRPEDTEASVARYAGYISGCFALCQTFTGVIWGGLSDKYGRKPILIIGLLGSSVSLLWFGLAGSFFTALLARSFGGLLNGNVGVMRTAVGETATERRHQALAFSAMPLLWQVGCVIGPMIGGSLATPVLSHPEWFREGSTLETAFSKHPFLLSNMVVSTWLFTSAVILMLFMEETHVTLKYARNRTDPGLKIGDGLIRLVTRGKLNHVREKEQDFEEEDYVTEETGLLSETETIRYDESDDSESTTSLSQKPKRMITAQVALAMASNAVFCMIMTIFEELMPVLLSTSVVPGSKFPFRLFGGLGMTSAQVGSLISTTGILGIVLMILLFPWVEGRFGSLKAFRFVSCISPFVMATIPYLVFLTRFENPRYKYIGALFTYFSKTALGSLGFPSVMLLLQRSVTDRSSMGTINGLSQMFVSAGLAIGPIGWGFLMATGQSYHIAWLPWWVLSFVAAMCAYISLKVRD